MKGSPVHCNARTLNFSLSYPLPTAPGNSLVLPFDAVNRLSFKRMRYLPGRGENKASS